jgi:hypothetical protein
MKKFVSLLLVMGLLAGAVFVYFTFIKTPEIRGCEKLSRLCGGDKPNPDQIKECVEQMRNLKEAGGPDALTQPLKCIDEATSCGEAVGCAAGAYGRAGTKILQDALKGLEKSLR